MKALTTIPPRLLVLMAPASTTPYRHDRQGNEHFGIIGMRERVEQAGGRFSIESGPGRGTLVAACVPLQRR